MAVVRTIKYPGDTSNDFNNWLNAKSEEREYFIKLSEFEIGGKFTHVRINLILYSKLYIWSQVL